jgi:hypothetical protein
MHDTVRLAKWEMRGVSSQVRLELQNPTTVVAVVSELPMQDMAKLPKRDSVYATNILSPSLGYLLSSSSPLPLQKPGWKCPS